ncbi:hypothetical protein R84B8_02894 [Treponema sp. R8-4-B8]
MIWLDTKEEVDFDWFMEVLRNNELQVVSKKLTKEDDEEICRAIDEYNAKRNNKAPVVAA